MRQEKKKWELRKRGRTKPGILLKNQIPVRTFTQWNEKKPGFLELDLVSHDGGVAEGMYAQTLDATDVLTGWTETVAVANKSQARVFGGLQTILPQFPFLILGIDSDNGAEFINDHLYRWCIAHKVTFTKSRPYNKNDNCYVEQKNWTAVRKTVGWWRFDTEPEVRLLNKLYQELRLFTNFFQPQLKMVEKVRLGSKVRKK